MSEGEAWVSRRELLRSLIGRVVQVVGVESHVPSPAQAPVLAVPYVPYTARPDEAGEGQGEEETR